MIALGEHGVDRRHQPDVAREAAQRECRPAAGIGKTRLLAETRHHAINKEFTVLAARAAELEQDVAFGIVLQLFEPMLARASEAERAERLPIRWSRSGRPGGGPGAPPTPAPCSPTALSRSA